MRSPDRCLTTPIAMTQATTHHTYDHPGSRYPSPHHHATPPPHRGPEGLRPRSTAFRPSKQLWRTQIEVSANPASQRFRRSIITCTDPDRAGQGPPLQTSRARPLLGLCAPCVVRLVPDRMGVSGRYKGGLGVAGEETSSVEQTNQLTLPTT